MEVNNERCGKCKNCVALEKVRRLVLAAVNPPFSSATGPGGSDYGVTDLWNSELERLPCLGVGSVK
jgi:hypothetical protein